MQEFCEQWGEKKNLIPISLFLKVEFDFANDVETNKKKKLLYGEKGKTLNIFGLIFSKDDDNYRGKGKMYSENKRMEITTNRRNLRIVKYSDQEKFPSQN